MVISSNLSHCIWKIIWVYTGKVKYRPPFDNSKWLFFFFFFLVKKCYNCGILKLIYLPQIKRLWKLKTKFFWSRKEDILQIIAEWKAFSNLDSEIFRGWIEGEKCCFLYAYLMFILFLICFDNHICKLY